LGDGVVSVSEIPDCVQHFFLLPVNSLSRLMESVWGAQHN